VKAYVSAARESFTPSTVRWHNSSPIQEHLKKQGVRFVRYLIVKANQSPVINADIFLDYIMTVFLPHLVWLCGLASFAEAITL
jgi:hypothetical protein